MPCQLPQSPLNPMKNPSISRAVARILEAGTRAHLRARVTLVLAVPQVLSHMWKPQPQPECG